MTSEEAMDLFEVALRGERQFVYLPGSTWNALRGSPPVPLLFLGTMDAIRWKNLPLWPKLLRITDGKERVFTPHITDDSLWRQVSTAYRLGRSHGDILFRDRSVGEIITSSIIPQDRHADGAWEGHLVVLIRRYPPAHIARAVRRSVEKLYEARHKDPLRAVRIARLLRVLQ